MSKTAILVDGGFYRRRAQRVWGELRAEEAADQLAQYCNYHLEFMGDSRELYRVLYYDCPPMDRKVYHPFLDRPIDFKDTSLYTWMSEFLEALKRKRKFALRLGKLNDTQAHFTLKDKALRNLCLGKIGLNDLKEDDFYINVDQKGVDMKIGIDIASIAYKKLADQIILISGDSDFVPVVKLARREGLDFVLDPMGANIKPDLLEHIDGITTYYRLCDPSNFTERQGISIESQIANVE